MIEGDGAVFVPIPQREFFYTSNKLSNSNFETYARIINVKAKFYSESSESVFVEGTTDKLTFSLERVIVLVMRQRQHFRKSTSTNAWAL